VIFTHVAHKPATMTAVALFSNGLGYPSRLLVASLNIVFRHTL